MVTVDGVKRKICLIGDWGVGKTSLIKKFVLNQFDDKYISTFGSKVYKKRVMLNQPENDFIRNGDEPINRVVDYFAIVHFMIGRKLC